MKTTEELRAQVTELYDELDAADNRGEYDPEVLNQALRATLTIVGQVLDIMSRAGTYGRADMLKGEI